MITYAKHTHVGERDNNEDSIGCFEKDEGKYCFVVADGLGGHGRGEEASKIVVDTFEEEFEKDLSMEEFLENSFSKGQEKLIEEQDKTNAAMELKTTAVALIIDKDKLRYAHIGDSRLYLFKDNKVEVHTLDHSVPQMLVFAGEIKEKHIRNHPDRNRLLRVLGARNIELKVDYSDEIDISDCQAFLLCSDGFWECITERRMCWYLKRSKSVLQWLDLMSRAVLKKGKGTNMDNNSAIAVFVK